MVSGTEKIRNLGSVILGRDFWIKEYFYLTLNCFLSVGRIPVPDHARRCQRTNLGNGFLESIPMGMSVIDHTEMSLCVLSCGRERIYPGIFFSTKDFHVVTTTVMDPVSSDLIVIFGRGLKSGDSDLADLVTDLCQTVTSTFYLPGVAQVRFLSDQHIAISHRSNRESHTDRVLGIVLQHRR